MKVTLNVLQWGCLSINFFVFPFIGIFLLHHIVNIESFPQITRFDPVTDFNQDQLPCFSHSDQLLSHVTWVQIDDLIVMNLDQIHSGCAALTYVDVNKASVHSSTSINCVTVPMIDMSSPSQNG